uniref:STAS domain-containing protein n=1 Tax=Heterorhabditis bacteriophora TaxID=37862 RepID=A0A1I7XLX3_HETBA
MTDLNTCQTFLSDRAIIIDATAMSYIDTMGFEALKQRTITKKNKKVRGKRGRKRCKMKSLLRNSSLVCKKFHERLNLQIDIGSSSPDPLSYFVRLAIVKRSTAKGSYHCLCLCILARNIHFISWIIAGQTPTYDLDMQDYPHNLLSSHKGYN